MKIYSGSERRFFTAVADLGYCNPFLPERIENEKEALGRDFQAGEAVWSASVEDPDAPRPNVLRVHARLEPMVEAVRARLQNGVQADEKDLRIYEECVHHYLYQRYYPDFVAQFKAASPNWRFFMNFQADWNRFLSVDGRAFETGAQAAHMFACFRQVQRAFHYIFDSIIGNSLPAARLRAAVWQSVFTYDMRRYRRTMYEKMGEFPTLITGPSGTGKELVARAIAGSRYVPFDTNKLQFNGGHGDNFFAINLAALSPTLVESELFGHKKGAFTGAVADRRGWLETCPATGAVFLDELCEMDLSIQVKLLRVLETRTFSPVGDTEMRPFRGKLIAATNRNLPAEIRGGRFREDLYYRLCADQVQTPGLYEQIRDSAGVFDDLLLFMVRRSVGAEAEKALPEIREWIAKNIPKDYSWPGNYRELEQCVRNVAIRQSYQPVEMQVRAESFHDRYQNGELTADEVLSHYAALVYRKAGSYEEAARRLGLDRRTVKSKVEAFLKRQTGA